VHHFLKEKKRRGEERRGEERRTMSNRTPSSTTVVAASQGLFEPNHSGGGGGIIRGSEGNSIQTEATQQQQQQRANGANEPPIQRSASLPTSLQLNQTLAEEEEDEDFLCPICREYPTAEVMQCAEGKVNNKLVVQNSPPFSSLHEGHIFCRKCYLSMLKLKPECATCRCYIGYNSVLADCVRFTPIFHLIVVV